MSSIQKVKKRGVATGRIDRWPSGKGATLMSNGHDEGWQWRVHGPFHAHSVNTTQKNVSIHQSHLSAQSGCSFGESTLVIPTLGLLRSWQLFVPWHSLHWTSTEVDSFPKRNSLSSGTLCWSLRCPFSHSSSFSIWLWFWIVFLYQGLLWINSTIAIFARIYTRNLWFLLISKAFMKQNWRCFQTPWCY